jgi:hypothetical protein
VAGARGDARVVILVDVEPGQFRQRDAAHLVVDREPANVTIAATAVDGAAPPELLLWC